MIAGVRMRIVAFLMAAIWICGVRLLGGLSACGLIVAIGSGTAFAGNGNASVGPNPDKLAFGLDRLHWDMSPTEVKAAYPKITPGTKAPGTFALTNLVSLYYDGYAYGGCVFDGVLSFDDGKLKTVEFTQSLPTSPNRPCAKYMEKEFSARYGVPVEHHVRNGGNDPNSFFPFDGRYGRYRGPVTSADYENSLFVDFSFANAAHPAKSVIIFDIQPAARPHPR